MDILVSYDWPGNVKELDNVIERAMVLCEKDILTADLFPALEHYTSTYSESGGFMAPFSDEKGRKYAATKEKLIRTFDQRFIEELLEETRGNVAMAAKISGIDRKNLYQKIKRLSINPQSFKNRG